MRRMGERQRFASEGHATSLGAGRLPSAPRLTVSRALCLLSLLLLLCGFRMPLLEEADVTVVFASDAERVDYAKPLVGTLEVTSNAHEEARLPDLRERLRGFAVVEDFEAGRTEVAGKARAVWRLRLTPAGEGPWRFLPFVVTLRDTRTGDARRLLTHVADFPAPLPLPEAGGVPECDPQPEWVAPGWRTFGLWGLCAMGVGGLAWGIFVLLRRLRRTLRERTLSPEERARLELDRLLAEGLLAQGRIKRFYFGLTGVVRRYFERACALRATRQTTQEFLAGLSADPRFGQAEREALSAFLAAADRVKFAGVSASAAEASASASAARALIAAYARRANETAPASDGA